MRLFVVGAAGRIGREIVDQALGHGDEVTALVHVTPLSIEHPRLRVVNGDARDFDVMRAAVAGQDAVAVALGRGAGAPRDLLESCAATLVHAMAEQNVARVAVVSAAGTFARSDRRISLGFRALIATTLRATYDDLEAMERRFIASGLDWTIVRPYGLSDGPLTGRYRVSPDGGLLPKASRVSRADVAAFVLKAVSTGAFARKAVSLAD